MIRVSREPGFTAVELLITLFIAAIFIIAGFSLYGVVIKDNGTTRAQSIASNLAYVYIREYTYLATKPCTSPTPTTPLSNSSSISGLSAVTVTVTVTCPYSGFPTLTSTSGYVPTAAQNSVSKVQATVTYNNPQQTTTNAIYVEQ